MRALTTREYVERWVGTYRFVSIGSYKGSQYEGLVWVLSLFLPSVASIMCVHLSINMPVCASTCKEGVNYEGIVHISK